MLQNQEIPLKECRKSFEIRILGEDGCGREKTI